MNKKLLLATLSLAALAACTDNDFESQNQKVAEEISPVQFELVNGNDALTRASMGGTNNNTISWSANDKDLFTLYHGAVVPAITGFENAIYTATPVEGSPAVLTTPSMIKQGGAIMVWPADTTFRIKPADNLTIKIPAEQTDIANQIPYVSDMITIGAYAKWDDETPATQYNVAGKDRKYPVYMRPMASQLNVFAKYEGTDEIDALVNDATDPIQPITVKSVALLTDNAGATKFSTELKATFTDATTINADATHTVKQNWDAKMAQNAWTYATGLDKATPVVQVARLQTTCPIDEEDLMKGCKFLILPQADIPNTGLAKAAIEVNTYYGQVLVAKVADYAASKYTDEEYNAAWYRYVSTRMTNAADENENVSATTGETINGKTMYKTVAKSPALGLRQTINTFSNYKVPEGYTVSGEYMGVASDRYVNVNLAHLDMSVLHVESDQQLRDVVRVWDALDLEDVTVFLDGGKEGDAAGEFTISQKTIAKINEINAAAVGKSFKVKPCTGIAGEACERIVITEGGDVPDLDFIVINGAAKADVVLKAGENWKWSPANKTVTVATAATTGISAIVNEGTLVSDATVTIAIYDNQNVPVQVSTIPFINDGTWNITAGDLTVQFDVTNNGEVNISAGAEYHQDIIGANKTTFINEATKLPSRFGGDDAEIGVVNNFGVFACTGTSAVKGEINNYGLIDHKAESAKTYITKNQNGGNFHSIFAATNKMGRINLPYDNRNEDNISISAAANEGFVSVTVSTGDGAPADGKLDLSEVGTYVNYCIINSGVTEIETISDKIKYLEFDDEDDTEIAWTVAAAGTYTGLMVLSPVNIKLGTTLTVAATGATYIGAKMYVGGTFTNTGGWSGYYGDTTDNVVNNYITY